MNESATIVQRLWNYCNVLRDDGVSYGDYVEQLTYLLFFIGVKLIFPMVEFIRISVLKHLFRVEKGVSEAT
jgi:hypothetical protein